MVKSGEPEPIRVTAVVEATTLTGPARNLLDFIGIMRQWPASRGGPPPVHVSVLTYRRRSTAGERSAAPDTRFVRALREGGSYVEEVQEHRAFDPGLLTQLRTALDRLRPAIVETHSLKSHFLMRLLGAARTRRWIAHHHGYTTQDVKMRVYNRFDRFSLRGADRVVSLSAAFSGELLGAGVRADRIRVIRSSIAPDWGSSSSAEAQAAIRARCSLRPGEQLILSVGRLSEEKGHIGLIRAFGLLQRLQTAPLSRLLIAGDGPAAAVLTEEIRLQGLGDRVVLIGHLDDVSPCYRAADLFVLSSHSEGSPVALLEAMLMRVPVVATAVGGVPEMVTADSALLVEPKNPAQLAAAMARLLADRALGQRLSDVAYRAAVEHHAPAARADMLLGVYRELVPVSVSAVAS
jgi:glycosyltransferase involved in cell wall biosynthesis